MGTLGSSPFDCLVDEGGAVFLEALDLALFLVDKGVDLGGFVVKEVGDGLLFG